LGEKEERWTFNYEGAKEIDEDLPAFFVPFVSPSRLRG
jgi:hypothetical protein